ncbi:MAG TPA: hypothetical protein VFP59_04820 [Candidatus Angelobacter sp.]|nr:hypothetical protein [Candidatus Angelobacter sp.]
MAEENEQRQEEQSPSAPSISLMRRQWLFLRHNWWDTGPLTPAERVAFFLRGFFLIVIGCVGLAVSIAGTLGSYGGGLDAIGKLMAEFMLIPIGLLALIVVALGGSLLVRSVIAVSGPPDEVDEQ